jgi:hypothetical protein
MIRDSSLKDDTQWDSYNCTLFAIVQTQDVFEILEDGYTPPCCTDDCYEKNRNMCMLFFNAHY